MKRLTKLWADEAGFIISAELCLVATIVVLGLIVGLVTVRNQIVQQCIAVGEAVGCINTSYAFCGLMDTHMIPPCAWTGGSWWTDYAHFCHPLPAQQGHYLWEGGITTLAVNGPNLGQGGEVGQ